jgi:Rhs element Vgr protein
MAVTTATIKSDGKVMNPAFELLSIDVTREFNKIPIAELKLIDGDVSKKEFRILDGDFFEPGKKIEISLKYEGRPDTEEMVFAGVVVNQGLELNRSGTTMMVEISDESVKMTSLRNNALYTGKKDSEIIKKLVEQNKLKVGSFADTKLPHEQMIQYYASDWDFVLSRAEANGQLVVANDGEVSTVRPEVSSPSLVLELGKDTIYDFDFQVNGLNQYQNVESIGWDVAKQALTKASKGKEYQIQQGNFNIKTIAEAVGGEKATLVHPVSLHPAELKAWADAQVLKSRLSLLRGWIKIPGTSKLKVGQTIEIKGVSQRFAGKNIISGLRHQVTVSDWVTLVQIGMDADWFMSQSKVVDTQAAGLLPGVNGLQVGLVVAHEKDPLNEFRVRVNIPAFDRSKGTIWARLASVDAGAERGVFFRPEIGDEVVVGFLNDDPRQAIVLGAVHSSAHQPPLAPTAKNGQKGIVTKLKYQLLFDEENETISLATSAQNHILIDEKNGMVLIEDAHGNRVEMSKEGVTMDSAKDFTITTKGDFEIAAKGNVTIGGKKVDLI